MDKRTLQGEVYHAPILKEDLNKGEESVDTEISAWLAYVPSSVVEAVDKSLNQLGLPQLSESLHILEEIDREKLDEAIQAIQFSADEATRKQKINQLLAMME